MTGHDKNCPTIKSNRKHKYSDGAWITEGLQNACKKKNTLCSRTKDAENKYRKYKNKLTNILRVCRKEHYSKTLINNTLSTMENTADVVNSCNHYFVSIGPNLAEQSPESLPSVDCSENLIDRNSTFLTAVEEKEITDIVNPL